MSRTLQKVIAAGHIKPGTVPTKIYVDKGKGSIVALEPVEVITEAYYKAVENHEPLLPFTDYRGNPSAVHVSLIKGYASLCSEQKLLEESGHLQPKPLKVHNLQQALEANPELVDMLGMILGQAKEKTMKQLES